MCRFIKATVAFCRSIAEYVLEFFFSLLWDRRREPIPDLDGDLACLTDSAVEMARKIKNRELRSEDLVQACINRIRQVNVILNAVIDDRYEEALREAREIDTCVRDGLTSAQLDMPFLGVPFTTKESQAVKGLLLTYGVWSRRTVRAREDSEAVVRMRAAGAIPLAVTNLPELLIWNETRNPVHGATKNPHHTGRSPGGSSGGEAALMACYATPISLCSDVAGSTRIPSFNCGLFGYHPTADTTNMRGMFGRTGREGSSIFGLGFISKNMEDQIPLMKVIAGDKAPLLDLDRQVDLKDIKVYYTEAFNDIWMSPITSDLKNVMKDVILKLEARTTAANSPRPYYHRAFDDAIELWRYWMSKEPEDYFSMYNNGEGRPFMIWEMIKKFIGFNRHSLYLVMRLAGLSYWPSVKADWAEPLTRALKDDLFSKLADNGVLILPSGPRPCPYNYFSYVAPYNFGYWSIVNVLKCPAVQVPLGRNAKGLPLGLQVVAAPNNDAVCIAVAKLLEKEYGGAIMACRAQQGLGTHQVFGGTKGEASNPYIENR